MLTGEVTEQGENIYGNYVLHALFCYKPEPKTALKSKIYLWIELRGRMLPIKQMAWQLDFSID